MIGLLISVLDNEVEGPMTASSRIILILGDGECGGNHHWCGEMCGRGKFRYHLLVIDVCSPYEIWLVLRTIGRRE